MTTPQNPPMEQATLLDFFAAAALMAHIQCSTARGTGVKTAEFAYDSAQSMLIERARRMQEQEKPE